ncbi:MAG: 4-hydroxybutyrate CoA-transferase [Caldilineales bacterium]|nr:4-hydroxybutyrate CoA-transferase [Caldilineales bacterium]MCW5859730.1 acetyl-CoA hydrolase/transferase family protein [Caldilineales bacterium]
MSAWTRIYESKITTADRAAAAVPNGASIFLTGNCSVPRQLLRALVDRARADQVEALRIHQVLTIGDADYVSPDLEGKMRVNTMFVSPNVRQAVNEGRADFTPVFLSEIPGLFKRGIVPLDIAFVHLSPPDEHGFCSYGIEVGLTKPAAESAAMVIAEVNDRMPRTLGDSFIHVSKLTHVVQVDYPLVELPQGEPGEMEKAIGMHVAELVPDGATMQLGIGAIPDGVLYFLRDKRHLGIHTELFSDGVVDLVERGVVTNERKSVHRGKIICGFILGSERLYRFVHDNAMVEFHPQDYVNDPFVIAQNDAMVSINSAIEVDLTGQVCADSMGHYFYSGVGGQLDFVRGASRSKGGRPIIALPSTAKDGAISRIVPALKPGAGVVTTRNDVHYVVTEYGVADLYGKSIRQRVEALIAIAHPNFRADLRHRARELHYL